MRRFGYVHYEVIHGGQNRVSRKAEVVARRTAAGNNTREFEGQLYFCSVECEEGADLEFSCPRFVFASIEPIEARWMSIQQVQESSKFNISKSSSVRINGK
jgi:hypothetical protein